MIETIGWLQESIHTVEHGGHVFYFGGDAIGACYAADVYCDPVNVEVPQSPLGEHIAKYRAIHADLTHPTVRTLTLLTLTPEHEPMKAFVLARERVMAVLAQGDYALNSIPLSVWDSAHVATCDLVLKANTRRRKVFGDGVPMLRWSLSSTVCLLKRVALDYLAEPGAEATARAFDMDDALRVGISYVGAL